MLEKEMFGEKLFENITAATNRMEWLRCWKKRVTLRNTLFLCDKNILELPLVSKAWRGQFPEGWRIGKVVPPHIISQSDHCWGSGIEKEKEIQTLRKHWNREIVKESLQSEKFNARLSHLGSLPIKKGGNVGIIVNSLIRKQVQVISFPVVLGSAAKIWEK